MSMTDPIADILTRMRNGLQAGHRSVRVPHSRLKEAIAQILLREGYLEESHVVEEGKRTLSSLLYSGCRRLAAACM
jgi:small subunit ribosomal protein S8